MEEDLKFMIERYLIVKILIKRVRIGKILLLEKVVVIELVKGEEVFQMSEVDEEFGLKDLELE